MREIATTHLMATALSVRFKFRITIVLSDMLIKILILFPHPISALTSRDVLRGCTLSRGKVGYQRKVSKGKPHAQFAQLNLQIGIVGEEVDTNHLGLCKQAWTSRELAFDSRSSELV